MLPALAVVIAQTSTEPACGPAEEASALCTALYRWTGNEVIARASDAVILKPAKVGLILVVALVVTRLARRALARFVAGLAGDRMQRSLGSLREHAPGVSTGPSGTPSVRAVKRAESIGALLRSVITVVMWSVAILMIMGELGLDLGPLLAGAGIVGIALGFGAQNMVRDFLSGIFMLIEDQYGVGDVIDVGPWFQQRPRVLGVEDVQDGQVIMRVAAEVQPNRRVDTERELRGRIKVWLDRKGIATPGMPEPVPPEEAG